MSSDDSEIPSALADYNSRRGSGWALCAAAVMSWVVSALAAVSVFTDPSVAGDLDSGTHIRNAAGMGWTSAVCGLFGLVLLIAAVWRGPAPIRWVGGLMLLLGGVPVLWLAAFAFLLSV